MDGEIPIVYGTHVNDGIQMHHAFIENLRFILRALSRSGSGVGQTIRFESKHL